MNNFQYKGQALPVSGQPRLCDLKKTELPYSIYHISGDDLEYRFIRASFMEKRRDTTHPGWNVKYPLIDGTKHKLFIDQILFRISISRQAWISEAACNGGYIIPILQVRRIETSFGDS